MGLKQRLKSRRQELQKEYPEKGKISLLMVFLKQVFIGASDILRAKIKLRACASRGRHITLKGKPLLKIFGEAHLGDEVRIWSNINKAVLFVDRGAYLKVGKNSRINGVHLSVSNHVEIGDNVRLAPYSKIIDSDFHKIDDHFSDDGVSKPIIIEDDVWVAMSAMVMKGVRIGKGAVVAAGAVVVKDVPAYTVVAGVPARVIKEIPH